MNSNKRRLCSSRGGLWEAERLFEQVLKADTGHFDSLYRPGVIRLQQNRFEEATRLFRRATI
jgi:cytochrome c-type biogenesis protein CcmH/NrfG